MAKSKKNKTKKLQKATTQESSPSQVLNRTTQPSIKASILIFLAAFGLYIQTISYEYVLDDQIVLTDNQFTNKGFAGLSEILTTESFAGYFGEQKDILPGARYRPLSIMTFAIENQFVGQNSQVSHFINTVLYALLCTLIYFTLSKMFMPLEPWYFTIPFIATLLFTLHPLHTEVVANVKGRDELLAMIFSISSLLAILKSAEGKRVLWLVFASISFFLGLLAKENTITFLAIIPMTLYVFTNKKMKEIITPTLFLLVITILYLILRYNVIGYLLSSGQVSNDIMNNPFVEMSIGEKYATIMYTLGHYLRLNIIPHPLTHDYYPFQIPTMHWAKLGTIISTLLYIGLVASSLYGTYRKKVWAYGILFYLLSLSIVSNLLINVGTTMNERFVFMASLGICITMAYLIMKHISSIHNKWPKFLSMTILAIFVVGFTVKSLSRIPVWKNPETLNTAAVKVSTNSARANSFMATALYDKILKGEMTITEKQVAIKEADYYADRSINIYPSYTNGNLMKAGISAEKYKLNNNFDILLEDFKKVAIRRPDIKFLHEYFDYLNPNQDSNKLINFYYDVGYNHLYNDGNYQWALTYLNYAYQLDQNNYKVSLALSKIYTGLGKPDKAAEFGYNAQRLKSNG